MRYAAGSGAAVKITGIRAPHSNQNSKPAIMKAYAASTTTKKRKTSSRLPARKTLLRLTNGNGSARPDSEQVREAAYFNYLNEGCPGGRTLQHWLDAEARLLGRSRAQSTGS